MKKWTVPPRARGGAFHVSLDGTHQRRNAIRIQFRYRSREARYRRRAGRAPWRGIQIVHRPAAQIHEVTAGILKSRQEILVANGSIHSDERIPHRAIESGLAMVEESAGCRGRFAGKQQPHLSRPERLSDYLGTRHSSCRIGASLMLAMRLRIRPCSSNSHNSLP